MTRLIIGVWLVTTVTATTVTLAAERLPEGAGLAGKYPGDRGLAKDPAVIFADDFESGDLAKWDDKSGSIAVTDEKPHGGAKCATAPMEKGKNHGGEAKKWFAPGADRVFVRTYVKFSSDYQYVHHFLTLLASPPGDRWRPFGKAGLEPDGTYFSTGMEPWFAWGKNPPPGELTFYSYFVGMEPDRKMNKFWGNEFFPAGPQRGQAASDQRVVPKLDTWQCWEFMVQANTPGQADGRQAMWLNGKKVGEFGGIRWRVDPAVKVNCFWLQHHGYDESDPTKQFHKQRQTVWFDDVVVAKEYVGPTQAAPQK